MTNKDKIKVVVFDFDDTLYSGLDDGPWKKYCKNSIINILSFLPKSKINEIKKDIENRSMSDRQVIEYLSRYGVSRKTYEEYSKTHEVVGETFENCKTTSNDVLKEFADHFKLYIASNSTLESVLKNCKKIGIDITLFKKIISNEFVEGKISKRYIYEKIIKEEKINCNELFVIGNNFEKDVLPALAIGANGKQILNADFNFFDFFDNALEFVKSNLFFTSDTHFSQERTLELTRRPFTSIDDMDQTMINGWNKVVKNNDIVFHLGDFGNYSFLNKLNGKKVLILGNYEQKEMEENFGNDFRKYKKYLVNLGFSAVIQKDYLLNLPEFKEEVYLTHKPIDCKKGMFNLFGHIHNLCKIKRFGLNVGTDNYNFSPASLEDVIFFKNAIQNVYKNNVFCTLQDLEKIIWQKIVNRFLLRSCSFKDNLKCSQ